MSENRPATTAPSDVNHPPRPGAKNRPTPKRRDQEAARRQPLVVADRKAAKEAEKQKAREQRASQRAAADRGEDSALPARDRGPERRYIRDRVDARLCMGEIVMPFMVLILVIWVIPNKTVQMLGMLVAWAALMAFAVDSFFMWRSIRKGLVAKFGEVPANSGKYAIMRGFQMRRSRFPKPMVKRGAKVS